MDTEGESGDKPSSNYRLVEEEFTIAVPLVRPKPAFLTLLQLAGAANEIFTLKEILRYMKSYIVERKLFDLSNPRIVHCHGDLLGEVFEVQQFTIDEVIELVSKSCTQLPDTCLKRRRRLVSKPQHPSISISSSQSSINVSSTTPTSVTISLCPSSNPSSLSAVSSSSTNKALSKSFTKSRKSSSSSLEKSDNSLPHMDKESERVELPVSKEMKEKDNKVSSGSSATNNFDESSESETSTLRKRKNKNNNNTGASGRKRHKTEPQHASCGESSRRRGTSLSITYGDDNPAGDYPWYFQVELGEGPDDDDDKSEVLSVQGKETVVVQDSTDDMWFLEEESISVEVPSDTDFSVEYDVESDVSPGTESDLSSVRSGEGLLVICKESDVEFFADCSDSDSDDGDKELSAADNWCCMECDLVNPPVQRYCSRCWKLRSDWLPSELSSKVRGDKMCSEKVTMESTIQDRFLQNELNHSKFKEKMLSIDKDHFDSGISSLSSTLPSSQDTVASDVSLSKLDAVFQESLCTDSQKSDQLKCPSYFPPLTREIHSADSRSTYSNFQLGNESSLSIGSKDSAFSPVKSSSAFSPVKNSSNGNSSKLTDGLGTTVDDRCMICLTGSKTASLIHGSSGHQVCCFSCAKRLKRRGKLCPVCRRPIQKVVKNYIL